MEMLVYGVMKELAEVSNNSAEEQERKSSPRKEPVPLLTGTIQPQIGIDDCQFTRVLEGGIQPFKGETVGRGAQA
jgi:hypothetical protein